jgi:hypothetical protein
VNEVVFCKESFEPGQRADYGKVPDVIPPTVQLSEAQEPRTRLGELRHPIANDDQSLQFRQLTELWGVWDMVLNDMSRSMRFFISCTMLVAPRTCRSRCLITEGRSCHKNAPANASGGDSVL